MIHKSLSLLILYLAIGLFPVGAQESISPHGLTVNMLYNTGQVFLNGYPVDTPLEKALTYQENWQFTEISTSTPVFGWMIRS